MPKALRAHAAQVHTALPRQRAHRRPGGRLRPNRRIIEPGARAARQPQPAARRVSVRVGGGQQRPALCLAQAILAKRLHNRAQSAACQGDSPAHGHGLGTLHARSGRYPLPGGNHDQHCLRQSQHATPANLYATFPPDEARWIIRKLDFRYTPKHGSWLNMAECAFAVLQRQCRSTRVASAELVAAKTLTWETVRNAAKATVTWRFTSTRARTKLKRLYASRS